MRTRALLKTILLAGLMALSITPSSAGTYRGTFDVVKIIYAKVNLHGGGTADVWLARLAGEDTYRPKHSTVITPLPGQDPHLGVTVNAVDLGEATYIGCISVKTSLGADAGCRVLPAATVDFDPAMQEGTLTFSVAAKIVGYQIVATLLVEGTTDAIVPTDQSVSHTKDVGTLQLKSMPPQAPVPPPSVGVPWLNDVTLDAALVFGRGATVTAGIVRSDIVQGGAVKSTRSASMITGFKGVMHLNHTNFFCTYDPSNNSEACYD